MNLTGLSTVTLFFGGGGGVWTIILLSKLFIEKFQKYFNIPFLQKLVIKYIPGS
jgi:hypothetical protein